MSREYKKQKRAESEAETRQRITAAIMHLHEAVGPAKTTVSAIADEAGVQRATVYRHFPDEPAQVAACSAHWIGLNPAPEIGDWAGVADPGERLQLALSELYTWYGRTEAMAEMLERDRDSVPAVDAAMAGRDAYLDAVAKSLLGGRPERGARRRLVRAAVAHALEFATWRSLVRRQGLSTADAVDLMTRLLIAEA
jgi:AcrR family transcriptional regulator